MPAPIVVRERHALAGRECAEHAMLMVVLQMIPVHGSASEPYLHFAGADVGRTHARPPRLRCVWTIPAGWRKPTARRGRYGDCTNPTIGRLWTSGRAGECIRTFEAHLCEENFYAARTRVKKASTFVLRSAARADSRPVHPVISWIAAVVWPAASCTERIS